MLISRFIKIKHLSPTEWEADTPSGNALYVCQLDTYIKPQFHRNVKCFFKKKRYGLTHEGEHSSPP